MSDEIPEILKDAFDALRSPDEDILHSFCLISGKVNGEETFLLAASISDGSEIKTLIPLFQSLPARATVLIDGVEAIEIGEMLKGH